MGNDDKQGMANDSPIYSNTVVDNCPSFFRESIPNCKQSFDPALTCHGDLHFDTTTDKIHSPGRSDQRADQRIFENCCFNDLQSLVGLNRGQNGFPHILINLSRVYGGTKKSVVEHVVCTRDIRRVMLW